MESLFEAWEWSWPFIIGYGYCLLIGNWFIRITVVELNRRIRTDTFDNDTQRAAYLWYPRAVGLIESIIYITSLLIGHGEFIAAWLAFKLTGRWQSHALEYSLEEKRVKDKPLFLKIIINNGLCNNFAIGNALSIIYAGMGWKMSIWLRNGTAYKTIFPILVLALLNWYFIRRCKDQTGRLEQIDVDRKQSV